MGLVFSSSLPCGWGSDVPWDVHVACSFTREWTGGAPSGRREHPGALGHVGTGQSCREGRAGWAEGPWARVCPQLNLPCPGAGVSGQRVSRAALGVSRIWV